MPAVRSRPVETPTEDIVWTYTIASERWRFRAYLGFWSMVIVAMSITKIYVVPRLAAGPLDAKEANCNEWVGRVSFHAIILMKQP